MNQLTAVNVRPISGDRCPLYFDDGENPWARSDPYFQVFDFGGSANQAVVAAATVALSALVTLLL